MAKSFNLFEQHLADLRHASPNADDVFVCPICFSVIPREDINENTVDLGHIWPKFFRDTENSDEIKHQQVLLCKSCNSSAGSQGDNEMQQHEKARRGLIPKKVWFYSPERLPFSINALLEMSEDGPPFTGNIEFKVHEQAWKNNERFQQYREIKENREKVTIAVKANKTNWQLAQAGWLTSAYLFAFYTFGYKYILHTILDPVRYYIQQSFTSKVDDRLAFNYSKDTSVQTCDFHYYKVPQIIHCMKTEGSVTPHHIQVSLLDYHIRLPIPIEKEEDTPLSSLPNPHMMKTRDFTRYTAYRDGYYGEELFTEPDYEIIGNKLT